MRNFELYILVLFLFLINDFRDRCKNEKDARVSKWGQNTSTTTIRRHFYTNHFQEWYTACTRMGISVLSQDTALQRLISDYQENLRQMGQTASPDSDSLALTVREYSPQAFSQSLIEWIVSDDQVGTSPMTIYCLH